MSGQSVKISVDPGGRRIIKKPLAEYLTPEEMSHITAVCQQPESLQNAAEALKDYISIITAEAGKRTGSTADPLLAAIEKNKYKKGTGGKQG